MRMRVSKSSARASAVLAGALLVHSLGQAAVFKAAPCDLPGMREAILQHVNQVRSLGFACGGQRFSAAQPLTWNELLTQAASGHSVDMAEHNYFDHRSLRGTKPAQRVDAVGYKWRGVAENIAAGAFTPGSVMRDWMASAGHCSNIMDPGYKEIGVACVARPGTTYGEYWTMVLGRR